MTNFLRARPANPVEDKLIDLKRERLTFPSIAQRLNEEGVENPHGTAWTRKSVKLVYDRIRRTV